MCYVIINCYLNITFYFIYDVMCDNKLLFLRNNGGENLKWYQWRSMVGRSRVVQIFVQLGWRRKFTDRSQYTTIDGVSKLFVQIFVWLKWRRKFTYQHTTTNRVSKLLVQPPYVLSNFFFQFLKYLVIECRQSFCFK